MWRDAAGRCADRWGGRDTVFEDIQREFRAIKLLLGLSVVVMVLSLGGVVAIVIRLYS